ARDGADESLLRALLLRLAQDRGMAAARAEYEIAVERLRRDYDIEPSIETRSLIMQLAPSAIVTDGPQEEPAELPVETGIPRIVLLPPECPLPVDPQAGAIADAMIEDVSLQLCRMRTFALFAPHCARQVEGLDPDGTVAPIGGVYVARPHLPPPHVTHLRH